MHKISPCLWFDGNAEEAADFYLSIFKNGKKGRIARHTEATPGPTGEVLTVEFELNGEKFLGLNGGPGFPFTNAVSFMVPCDTQEEIDYYWEKLSAGGTTIECGWLKDKFGLLWQIFPAFMSELITGPRANEVMKAMRQMKKLDLATLKKAGSLA